MAARILREILVFLPNADAAHPPLATAREMVATLGVGRAEIGVDALTGGVEVRLYFDPSVLVAVRDYARATSLPIEVDVR